MIEVGTVWRSRKTSSLWRVWSTRGRWVTLHTVDGKQAMTDSESWVRAMMIPVSDYVPDLRLEDAL